MIISNIFNSFSPSNEEPDSWEESYLTFADAKPRGPEAIALDFTFQQADVLFGNLQFLKRINHLQVSRDFFFFL